MIDNERARNNGTDAAATTAKTLLLVYRLAIYRRAATQHVDWRNRYCMQETLEALDPAEF